MNKHYVFWYRRLAGIALLSLVFSMMLNRNVSALAMVAGVVAALIIPLVLIWIANRMGYPIGRAVHCPNCGTEMPITRRPTSAKQAVWGGYTCPNCGTELDAKGHKL